MAQLFGRKSNWILRAGLALIPALCALSLALAVAVDRSDYVSRQNEYIEQPVPFSHQHHVGELGIDCRYCHVDVERGAYAGLPSVEVCMSCHSQIWKRSRILAPVRHSFTTSTPLKWARVTTLPDYVYFNHSIHISKGISCLSCHGPIESMPLTYLAHPMHMEFCLNCHRDPQKHLRVQSEIYRSDPDNHLRNPEQTEELMKTYHIEKKVDCTICHR